MPMGHSACLEVVIEVEKLEEIVPVELKQLNDFFENKEESSLDELIRSYCTDDACDGLEEKEQEEAIILLNNLLKAFKDKTGIELLVGYHDNESSGDCYDEVDGAFFTLEWTDVFTLTPEAKALKDKFGEDAFDIKRYVVYG